MRVNLSVPIYWIDIDSYLPTNPFTAVEEKGAVEHMNEDHVSAIRHYCILANIPLDDDDSPEISGVDGEGFHIRIGLRIHRFHFDAPIVTTTELRQKLTELAHQAA
ncbi:MAG: putative heme iron utilization protein [Pseudohongiellaceae bacterium]